MKTTEQSDEDDDTNDESDKSLAIKRCYNGGDESDKSLATKAQFAFQDSVRNKMCKRSTAGESELAAVAPAQTIYITSIVERIYVP